MPLRALLAFLALVALPLAGCGGGGATVSTTAISTEGASSPPTTARPGSASHGTGSERATARTAPRSTGHHQAATGAASFETKGGDNSIQESGSEASESELGEAAANLRGYLGARADGDWAKACSYAAAGLTAQLSQLAAGAKGKQAAPSCARVLASLSASIPVAARREAAIAHPGALRTEGDRAFLLFRGARGVDYFMPMAQEGGVWKVAAIAPSPLS